MSQIVLPLTIQIAKEVNGLEMGVLSDGTPYLSGRSLAKLVGIASSTVSENAAAWLAGTRESKFARWVMSKGFAGDSFYAKTDVRGVAGNNPNAFPADVCTMFLEYYAFESPNATALNNCRALLHLGLGSFIYRSVGYDPQKTIPDTWHEFRDRLQLHTVPHGHFSVFREMADIILAGIRVGLHVDHRTVPDIGVGQLWSKYWKDAGLESAFGARRKFDHNFPEYFPQAASNPQEMWVYPLAALGEFRLWMQREYLPTKFGNYLSGKVGAGLLSASGAELLLVEVGAAPQLEP